MPRGRVRTAIWVANDLSGTWHEGEGLLALRTRQRRVSLCANGVPSSSGRRHRDRRGRGSYQKTRLQSATDAAILAGAVAAKKELERGGSRREALATARSTARSLLQSNFGDGGPSFEPVFRMNGLEISGTGTASFTFPTYFMGMFGTSSTTVKASSQAQAIVEPFINIYLLVDISASMLLPATNDGIAQMRSGTGCALACHDKTDGTDTYAYAKRNNILMRYEVVNQGIDNLLNYIRSRQSTPGRVRVELWSFDHDMRRLVSLTPDLARVSSNFPAPALASTEESAATRFDDLIGSFVTAVGTSGSGESQSDAKKLVMIATDGVNDPTRAWTWNTPLRADVRAFNTAFCDTLKSRGNTVSIINTPYLPMPWDWGYNATLGTAGASRRRHTGRRCVNTRRSETRSRCGCKSMISSSKSSSVRIPIGAA